MKYEPRAIEKKWSDYWQTHRIYEVATDTSRPKFYVLDMFPYPSGAGLHVGHPLGYIASDIFARYKRLKGFNVLHPMGFDAFGLPAEQYAIETGVHPSISTANNIKRYRSQLDNIGFSFDWSRSVTTSDPSYYRWTQWIFLQLFDHYYDQEADKALLISDLIGRFEKEGNAHVRAVTTQETTFSAAAWNAFAPAEKADVLMNYRLMYRKVSYVNWCEALGTVLANDEVKDGVSERGGYPVVQKPMLQWSLRITAYAERLLADLDAVDWSEALKNMQRNWIGKSEGATIWFDILGHDGLQLEIFTTRPDTIFGATFMVLAPEHDLVPRITTDAQRDAIRAYEDYANARTERDRMETKRVTGAFTGAYARNPFTNELMPIWIAEYVLKDYGTGAIMAVPSDDERDQRFAEKFGLPMVDVVDKTDYPGATLHDKIGKIIHSDFLNGMEVMDAIRLMFKKIEDMGIGKRRVNYKLRDANYSRQRYWGEPFPIYYDEQGVAQALPADALPLELPPLDDIRPMADGSSPLAKATDWVHFEPAKKRETDTMPGFAGSSWYFLRYMDAQNTQVFAAPDAIEYWRDVDLYVGGTEHAVGHLMYSRCWHKFLFDKGLVPTAEPFKKLINQGMIQGIIESIYYVKSTKTFISAELAKQYDSEDLTEMPVHVDFVTDYGKEDSHLTAAGIEQFKAWRPDFKAATFVLSEGSDKFFTKSEVGKMSKSKYNVINPDDVIERYGADCFRMYEMFLGPVEQSKPWDTKGIEGVSKFLRKYWSLFYDENDKWCVSDELPSREELKILHYAIKRITDDIERFSLNTCVSSFMVAVNELKRVRCSKRTILEPLTVLLAPFAPFVAEEIWQALGYTNSIFKSGTYPVFEASHLVENTVTYPISVNGKKRATADFPTDWQEEQLRAEALSLDVIKKAIAGKQVVKVVIVPQRMINIVVK